MMIYTRKNLTRKKENIYIRCNLSFNYTGAIYVTKGAARLINAPCKLAFDFDNMLCMYHDDGLNVTCTKGLFYINSLPLIRKLKEILPLDNPRFEITKVSGTEGFFQLKLITQ